MLIFTTLKPNGLVNRVFIMYNPFLDGPSEVRKQWKSLRDSLTLDLDDMSHLEATAKWWSRAPIVKSWIDWDYPQNWPNPWELITAGHFDNSAIAIGMAYTLFLCKDERWDHGRVKLALVCDQNKTMQHLIVIVDDSWILNRTYAQVERKDDDLIIQDEYVYDGKIFRALA
jgi:hypothetical protein